MRWPTCSRTTATPRSSARNIPWAYLRYSNFPVGMSKAWRLGGGQECRALLRGSTTGPCFPLRGPSATARRLEYSTGIPRSFWHEPPGKWNVGSQPSACGHGPQSAWLAAPEPPATSRHPRRSSFGAASCGGRSGGRSPADHPRRERRPHLPVLASAGGGGRFNACSVVRSRHAATRNPAGTESITEARDAPGSACDRADQEPRGRDAGKPIHGAPDHRRGVVRLGGLWQGQPERDPSCPTRTC